jgi:histidinol-phosphate/aromatic aminotransferase/cobyric acid decarboxylase-like protein
MSALSPAAGRDETLNPGARHELGSVPPAHGGYGRRLAAALGLPPDRVLDLSATLNPLAPDPVPVVAAHLDALRRYPDPAPAEAALAAVMGVPAGRLVLTNGGAEAIALVAARHPAGWVEEPEFSLYRRHLAEVAPGQPRWRSNPANPIGLLAPAGDTAAVWDEAFWPLATGTWTRGDAECGSVVVGSLTKLLACPGLRVGYVLCPDEAEAADLRRRRPQWSVNGLVAEALPELLAPVELPAWAAAIARLRARLSGVLAAAGYPPRPSDAPWLLVDDPRLAGVLAAAGVCVRDCSSFGMPATVRIAVPGEDGLQRVAAALGVAL